MVSLCQKEKFDSRQPINFRFSRVAFFISHEVPCVIVAAKCDLDPCPHGNSHLHVGPTHTCIQPGGPS